MPATALAWAALGTSVVGSALAIKEAKKSSGPKPTTPPIVQATPPATPKSVEVTQSKRDFMKKQDKRRGYRKSIFAGETGGYNSATILQQLGGRS